MSDEKTYNITDVPATESKTRDAIKKGVTITAAVLGTFVVVDAAVKRFAQRKNVTLTVEDKTAD